MRVSRDQVLENKRAILAAAVHAHCRERGFDSVSVAVEIMKSAGLTHGASTVISTPRMISSRRRWPLFWKIASCRRS